jgi:hypothetical protein
MTRIAWLLVLASACTPGTSEIPPETPYLFPDVIHTGFDNGAHTFRVPIGTNMAGNVQWEVADPSIATLEEIDTPPGYASVAITWMMITATAPGTTRIIARLGDAVAEAELTVDTYVAADVDLGDQRYNMPANPVAGRESCASCHVEAGGKGVEAGVDHSPIAMTLFTDEDILSVIETSAYPNGGYVVFGGEHIWDLTPEERAGIVPYIRSLDPRGF